MRSTWKKAGRRAGGWASGGLALPALLALTVYPAARLAAQGVAPLALRFADWTAVVGYERAVTDTLLTILPGAARDRFGNVILTLGRGEPRRLASCALDEPGFVVGNVTDDGYLRLRRVPGPPPVPLYDQELEGQRVTLFGDAGPVPGVVAVRSVHLTRFRGPAAAAAEPPFTVDDAYVDVGATSRAEVERLGIRVLTPLVRTKRAFRYGDGDGWLAAPLAGQRAACAALAAAALARPRARGSVVVAFTVESRYRQAGEHAVEALLGPFQARRAVELDARYRWTQVETVSLTAADSLERDLVAWMEGK